MNSFAGKIDWLEKETYPDGAFKGLVMIASNQGSEKDVRLASLLLLMHHNMVDFDFVEAIIKNLGYIKDPEKTYNKLIHIADLQRGN